MLRIYDVAREMVRGVAKMVEQIKEHNPKLADQLDRSSRSVTAGSRRAPGCAPATEGCSTSARADRRGRRETTSGSRSIRDWWSSIQSSRISSITSAQCCSRSPAEPVPGSRRQSRPRTRPQPRVSSPAHTRTPAATVSRGVDTRRARLPRSTRACAGLRYRSATSARRGGRLRLRRRPTRRGTS